MVLNKIISNFNSLILNKYHGIDNKVLPLYFSEFEWRFNHCHTADFITKIKHYIQSSFVMTRKSITVAMDLYAIKRGVISCWGCQKGIHINYYFFINFYLILYFLKCNLLSKY